MKRVVLKSPVADYAAMIERMAEIGSEFGPAVWQQERIYLPADFKPRNNQPRLVVRTEVVNPEEPANYYLFLKRHIEDSGIDYVHQTTIGDPVAMEEIAHQLGYRKVAELNRQRQSVLLDDYTVLHLDTVEGMSTSWLKIEQEIVSDLPVSVVQAGLFQTLRLLGLSTFVLQTYAELSLNPAQPYYLPEPEVSMENDEISSQL